MSEKKPKMIGDYFTLQRGTTYESKLLDLPGPVLLGLGSIQRNGGFRSDSLRTYGGDSPDKLLVKSGGLYVSLKDVTQSADLLGAVARLPRDHAPGRLTQDTVKLDPKSDDVPIAYLYWLLRTPEYRSYCKGCATGTTNLGLSREDFLSFPANDPSEMQSLLVRTLDSLDDKIELNRRMNEILEAIVRAIFKSWFVDFDPVRAKASGEPPESTCRRLGLTPDVLALFPDSFQDSELGEIPRGWTTTALQDVMEVNPPRALRKGCSAPYLDMANMPTSSARASEIVAREFGSGMKFKNGDTLVARITPCLENGKTCFVDFLRNDEIGWGSTEYIVLRPKSPLPPEFGYFLARTDSFRSHAIANMTGTSGRQRVPATAIENYRLVVPMENGLTAAFGGFAGAVLTLMRAHDGESRFLVDTRATLLPKLLSGDLATSNVETAA